MGVMNDAMSGYKTYPNTQGFTNESLLEKLSGISVSFGTPAMGKVGKDDAVVYEGSGRFIVYAKVTKKNIQVSRTFSKDTKLGVNLLKELAVATVSDAQAKDTAEVERYVDELGAIIEKLVAGIEVVSSNVSINTASGEAIKFYMKQKVLAIKDKYSICDYDQNPKYWVVGSLIGLSFSVQDANGSELMIIKKKMVAILPEYTLIKNGEEIAHIKKKLKLTRPEIDGDVNGKALVIKGDITGYHFNIELGGQVIGNVDTERLTWGDCYSIEVLDESMKDLVVAIAIICDNTLKNKS